MRIFENTAEAYPEILRDIVKFGREEFSNTVQNLTDINRDDYLMKELQLYSFCILDDSDRRFTCKDPEWVLFEHKERISPERFPNPGVAYKLREDYWKQFQDAEGKFCYTYGDRIVYALSKATKLLQKNPGTRQAIISVWDREIDPQNTGGKKRVPCSVYYNVQIRDGKLDIIYHMRSSDFFEHFKNDVTLAGELRNTIANYLKVPNGKLFMVVDSLHAYKKNWGTLGIF